MTPDECRHSPAVEAAMTVAFLPWIAYHRARRWLRTRLGVAR